MTHDELIAREEIYDALVAYATATGSTDWAAYRRCFSPEATVDYTSAGGVSGTIDDAVAWLEPSMAIFDVATFQVSNVVYAFDGPDRCNVRSMFHTVMRIPGADEAPPTYVRAGGYYDDVVTKGADGWKIARRVEQFLFAQM